MATRGGKRRTAPKPKAKPAAKAKGKSRAPKRKVGRSLSTWAIKGRKGAAYQGRLSKPKAGLRAYTPLTKAARPTKSTPKQKAKSRKYYKANRAAILQKAAKRYRRNKSAISKYSKRYYTANKPNVNYRRSQLRAKKKGKKFNLSAARKRGVGTTKRRARKPRK